MINYFRKHFSLSALQSASLKLSAFILLIIPILYLRTLARTLVLGDPTEYTFIANILGIAHPPGYAFITLLGKLFQTLIPFGEIPWRMHLLSATAATLAVLFVFGTVKTIVNHQSSIVNRQSLIINRQSSIVNRQSSIVNRQSSIIALLTALTVGTAVNFWQHAIHANPHIITATFLAANLYFLTKWACGDEGVKGRAPFHPFTPSPLHLFALSAGLGVTHHPLTVFGFPAYALFVVWTRPSILKDWRTLLKMAGFALLGLSVWLYYPLRSPHVPFGPTSMNTLNGFLDHVLARGLSESLPYFSLAEQGDRLIVFWSILRLQYSLPVILLAIWGLIWPFLQREYLLLRRLVVFYALTFISFYAFVISLRAQDVMAYILGPVLIVGLLSGIGLFGLLRNINRKDAEGVKHKKSPRSARLRGLILLSFFAFGPGWQIFRNAPLVSLRDYDEGQVYVDAVFDKFAGTNEGAVLLNDWEHMTPLWYTQFVEKRWPAPADVRPEFVSAAKPWVEFVFDFLPGGPVYLSNYRRDVVDFGFRLRPEGPFYKVIDANDPERYLVPSQLTPANAVGEVIEVVGYEWAHTAVTAGDYIPLTLAMRTPTGTADFYVPVLHVGQMEFAFTTDSHLTTPNWLPGEVVVEQFDFALPHDLASDSYPVTLDLKNLSTDEIVELNLSLGQLVVTGLDDPLKTDHLLANFRQRVGLVSAVARQNGQRRTAPWLDSPIQAQPGDIINLTLQWQALDYAEESYTVFVHLIDLANQPYVTLDYTPLGGAMPTHLWFPKWLPGQQMLDPYRLPIRPDLPPGTYLIEVGLYEMVSKRRLHRSDANGNLIGDRYILGNVIVNSSHE